MNLTVLGCGAWGTALAVQAADRHAVVLWGRDAGQNARLAADRVNSRYLPGIALPQALAIEADFDAALDHAADGLVLVATPMSALSGLLRRIPPAHPVLWLCKGFEAGSGHLGHEIAANVRPGAPAGVLSGPSFAIEVARGMPTALLAASLDEQLCARAVQAFHARNLRIYTSDDPVGVEVGGAVKNVMAIATGICDGMRLGQNARAALITRGLAEMTRLGVALGARADTFMGLSGLGDLVLTATGDLSRNRSVGLRLAEGLPLDQVLADLGHVAEGVYSAATVAARARSLGVPMPITDAVVAVLEGRLHPAQAVDALMNRESRAERLPGSSPPAAQAPPA